MSRKKDLQVVQQSMPSREYLLTDQFQYQIGNGHVTIAFAAFGKWHGGITIPVPLMIELHQKLGISIADVIRKQSVND